MGDLPINVLLENQSSPSSSAQLTPEIKTENSTEEPATSRTTELSDGIYILNKSWRISWDMQYLYQPGTPAITLEYIENPMP